MEVNDSPEGFETKAFRADDGRKLYVTANGDVVNDQEIQYGGAAAVDHLAALYMPGVPDKLRAQGVDLTSYKSQKTPVRGIDEARELSQGRRKSWPVFATAAIVVAGIAYVMGNREKAGDLLQNSTGLHLLEDKSGDVILEKMRNLRVSLDVAGKKNRGVALSPRTFVFLAPSVEEMQNNSEKIKLKHGSQELALNSGKNCKMMIDEQRGILIVELSENFNFDDLPENLDLGTLSVGQYFVLDSDGNSFTTINIDGGNYEQGFVAEQRKELDLRLGDVVFTNFSEPAGLVAGFDNNVQREVLNDDETDGGTQNVNLVKIVSLPRVNQGPIDPNWNFPAEEFVLAATDNSFPLVLNDGRAEDQLNEEAPQPPLPPSPPLHNPDPPPRPEKLPDPRDLLNKISQSRQESSVPPVTPPVVTPIAQSQIEKPISLPLVVRQNNLPPERNKNPLTRTKHRPNNPAEQDVRGEAKSAIGNILNGSGTNAANRMSIQMSGKGSDLRIPVGGERKKDTGAKQSGRMRGLGKIDTGSGN